MLVVLPGASAEVAGQAASNEVVVRRDLRYATHDGVALDGDYYLPKGGGRYPVVISVHGGGWQGGSRNGARHWGQFLAERGVAVYAISYRLSKPGQPTYPHAVHDVRAAVQFVRHNAVDLQADPARLVLMGDSAGGHLVALVGLAADAAPFANAYPGDPYAAVSAKVTAVVASYGIFDLVQQWNHDQIARPRDQIAEKFLGKAPMDDRKVYFEASPLSYAVRGSGQPSFLLVWGTADDVVDPVHQSEVFLVALKQAGIFVRTIPVAGAPHFWMSDPIDGHSTVSTVAPQVFRFLANRLMLPE
jgi:acetyl esterase/lipase